LILNESPSLKTRVTLSDSDLIVDSSVTPVPESGLILITRE